MIPIPQFPYKPTSLLFGARSRWWGNSNNNDELEWAILTLSLIFLVITSYAWMFVKKGVPPLPPGPRGLPLVGNLPFLDHELHVYFAGLARVYGPIVKLRLGNMVGIVVSSPSASREVLKDHDVTFANRNLSAAAIAVINGDTDVSYCSYGPEWRMRRKVVVRDMLSSTTLDAVYPFRRREVRRTIGYIYSRVGSPVNVGEQVFFIAFNVITSMLWGGSVKREEGDILGTELRQAAREITWLLGKPNISDFYPCLARFDLQGIQKQLKRVAQRFDRIFDSVIDQRLNIDGEGGRKAGDNGKKTKDFLQVLLGVKNEGDAKKPLSMTNLKAILMDMVVGGTDTNANTVEFAIGEMLNKPETMRKALEELDLVVGKESIVEETHIHKLPYLNAVMKEVLRLHPALPLLIPHCPSESCIVGGYNIPKGAQVFVNAWAIHRDPSVWENPNEFDPERFMNGKLELSGNDFNYIPFGSGRRMCAGMAMAERTVMFSLASLLHSFDWKLPEGEKIDLSEKFGMVLKKKMPLIAIPTPRLSDPALYE